jgi:hypothetical protein
LEEENAFFLKGINKKCRNYNLWTYRMTYIKFLIMQDPSIWKKEIDFMMSLGST